MPDDPFLDLLSAAQADEAAGARARERWLRRQAEEDASVIGTLVDLAERAQPVVLTTTGGRRHVGVLGAVGVDFCTLRLVGGQVVYVALREVALVQPEPGSRPGVAGGEREAAVDATLIELLARAADDRVRVVLSVRGVSQPVVGELRAVGADVLTVRLDGSERAVAYVAAEALVDVVLASG